MAEHGPGRPGRPGPCRTGPIGGSRRGEIWSEMQKSDGQNPGTRDEKGEAKSQVSGYPSPRESKGGVRSTTTGRVEVTYVNTRIRLTELEL